ncbi:hypothetical protein [Enterococcus sp. LJL90]
MSAIKNVVRTQRKLFFQDKGMLVFYGVTILGLGIVLPLFIKSITAQLTLVTFMTTTLQKQWTAESIAGERENKTLESLLSTPLETTHLIVGKSLFNLGCGLVYSGFLILAIFFTRLVTQTPQEFSATDWLIYLLSAIMVIWITAFYGVLCSGTSATVSEAGKKPAIITYFCSLLVVIVLSTLMLETLPLVGLVVIIAAYFILTGLILFVTLRKIFHMSRMKLIEIDVHDKAQTNRDHSEQKKSAYMTVFAHEYHYFKTLKRLTFNFTILSLCPAGIYLTAWLLLGQLDLNYSILLTIAMIPRIPTNLIAYAVGGEKVYKTGEAILATPLSTTALLFGKALLPLLISGIMLLISAVITILCANLIAWSLGQGFIFYSITQLILLSGVGLATSLVMIFAMAILSLAAKTPRKGLYFATFLGLVFFIPVIGIIYLFHSSLLLSACYLLLLLGTACYLYLKIRSVSRIQLM